VYSCRYHRGWCK